MDAMIPRRRRRPAGARARRRAGGAAGWPAGGPAAVLLALAAACAGGGGPEGIQSRPAGDEGMLVFTVGRLSFEGPAAWEASGDFRRVRLVSPQSAARIDVQVTDRAYRDDRECLAQANEALERGQGSLSGVRRHATRLAGRRAVVQEADQAGWHGWAWAVCDGGEQYRLFFTGRSPLGEEELRVSRLLPWSAVLARSGAR